MQSVATRTRTNQITLLVAISFLFYEITNWQQGIWVVISTTVVAGPFSTFLSFEKGRNRFLGTLVGLIIAGSGVFFFASAGVITYWIGGLALCLFVGPAQASSRTFVSRFTPAGREGEVFGLYQFTGRAVSFLSGSLWALSITIAHTVLGVEKATIWGIWGLMLILVVGLFLLTRVHPRPAVLESH